MNSICRYSACSGETKHLSLYLQSERITISAAYRHVKSTSAILGEHRKSTKFEALFSATTNVAENQNVEVLFINSFFTFLFFNHVVAYVLALLS
jgi:hypothetical protein